MTAHRQAELVDVDIGRDYGPVPADVELFVRREDTLVEYLERRLQQRWPRSLQGSSRLFCGKAVVSGRVSGPPGRGRSTVACAQAGAVVSAKPAIPAWPRRNRLLSGRRRGLLSIFCLPDLQAGSRPGDFRD